MSEITLWNEKEVFLEQTSLDLKEIPEIAVLGQGF